MSERRDIAIGRTTLPGLDRLSEHLRFLTQRNRVLAGNLANLDTPGYRAKDLELSERFDRTVTPEGVDGRLQYQTRALQRDDEVPDQDGNSVSLEAQVANLDDNTLRYRSLAEVLSRRIGLLRYAATDGRG
ncbi:MAG: hypothetical protein IPK74_20485 [Deltaproteobacteria bacterium]|nr:hypothetical protein [Deltaproteobacteria bacterium]